MLALLNFDSAFRDAEWLLAGFFGFAVLLTLVAVGIMRRLTRKSS